jgi:hypothetical protein
VDDESGQSTAQGAPGPVPRDPPPPPGYVDPLEGSDTLDELLPEASASEGGQVAHGDAARRSP